MMPHHIILIIVCASFLPEVIYIFQLFRKNASGTKLFRASLKINMFTALLGVFLLASGTLYDVNFLQYKAPMEYSQWEQIEWSDFRAIKRPHQTLDGSESFAFICSDIDVTFNNTIVSVVTRFHPSRSYTFSEEKAGIALLQHELYHLHITERWARELRKELTIFGSNQNNSKLTAIVNRYRDEERQMQIRYDDDTYHGYLLGKQQNWQNKVDSMLMYLSEYSEPSVKLK